MTTWVAISATGTVVLAGSGGTIVDASHNKWTISPESAVLKNGLLVGFTANVAEIAYVKSVMWHENTGEEWYSWNGSQWIAGDNPLPAPTTTQLDQIITYLKELKAMGTTIGTDVSNLTTDVGALTTGLVAQTAAFNALLAAFNGATNLTPAQQTALEQADADVKAAVAQVSAETTEATSAVKPPPPAA